MPELLVMRHAKSAWDTGAADFDRPLNPRGVEAADRMARWLADNDLEPDQVLSSSAVRAQHTAMAVVHECAVDRFKVDFDDQLYLADAFDWLFHLRKQATQRLLICGHNPGLDDLVEYLSSEPPELSASHKLMTTAAIAHLFFEQPWSEIAPGSGRLVELVRPRELATHQ